MEYNVYNQDGQLVGYCDENGLDAIMAEGLYCVASENIATDVERDAADSLREHSAPSTKANKVGDSSVGSFFIKAA
jgi:hypothetical protein